MAIGTWLPIAGAILGAVAAGKWFHGFAFIGAAAGLLLTSALFAAVYFRSARLVAT
jgi:hypothetical protein